MHREQALAVPHLPRRADNRNDYGRTKTGGKIIREARDTLPSVVLRQ